MKGRNIPYQFSRVVRRRRCTNLFFMIWGRTDLRIGLSGAKFDAESDFEVRLAVAPQKPSKNNKKLIFSIQQFHHFFFRRRK